MHLCLSGLVINRDIHKSRNNPNSPCIIQETRKLKIMNPNKPFLNPILKQTLEFVSLGIATSGFIIGVHIVVEQLKEESDKATFEFAVHNHLGGSLLPVARNLMEFTREQTIAHLWYGALIGVAVSSVVMLLVVLFLTTGKYYLDRAEYIDLLDKASRWDYHLIKQSKSKKSKFNHEKTNPESGEHFAESFSDSYTHS